MSSSSSSTNNYIDTINPKHVLAFVKSKNPNNYIAIICEAIALDTPADIDGYMFDNSDLLTYYIARIEAQENQKQEFDKFVANTKPTETLVVSDNPYRDVASATEDNKANNDDDDSLLQITATDRTEMPPVQVKSSSKCQTARMNTTGNDNESCEYSDDEIASWFDDDGKMKNRKSKAKQARTKGQLVNNNNNNNTILTPLEQQIQQLKEELKRPPPQSSTGSLFKPPYNPRLHELMQEQRNIEDKHISNAKLLQKLQPTKGSVRVLQLSEIEQLSRKLGL